tara:strand:+ start:454 stop:2262 length:1809 start_codon:yes stop_codon:yes gene_type:complete
MVWSKAGTTSVTSGSSVDVTSIPNSTNYSILFYTDGGQNGSIRAGNSSVDTGSNYSYRSSRNGASDGTTTSNSAGVRVNDNAGSSPNFTVSYMINIATEEKLIIAHTVEQMTAGAGTVPNRNQAVGKWANTSNVLDIIQMNQANLGANTNLTILGSKGVLKTRPTNVEDNSILIEKDTGERYWFDAESESAENITWSATGKVGFNISGTTITRTGSSGWSLSKIQSEDTFTVGNGTFMIEFSGLAPASGSTMLGFNAGTLGYYYGSGTPINQADFSIYMAGGDTVEVYESGTKSYGSGGTRSASDKYRIEINNDGLVKYYLQAGGTGSWVLKYTSSTTASGTYFIQANAYSSAYEATVHSKYLTTPATWTKGHVNPAWTVDQNFSSSTGWTFTNTSGTYWNIASTKLNWRTDNARSGSGANYDLTTGQSVSNLDSYDTWLLRFELTLDTAFGKNQDALCNFGIHDNDDFGNPPNNGDYDVSHAQVQIQVSINDLQNNLKRFQAIAENSDDIGQDQTMNNDITMQSKYYIEIKKTDATTYVVGYSLNSDYTTSQTVRTVTGLTLSGLKYLHFEAWEQGNNSSYESWGQGWLENLKFYAGVSSL